MFTEIISNAFKDGDASTRCVSITPLLRKYVYEQVQKAVVWSGLSELTLFVFLIWATPIERRLGDGLYVFGGIFFATLLLQTAFHHANSKRDYSRLILISKMVSLIAWGGLTGWTLTQFEISWTSFIVLLSTLALSSLQVVIYAPKMRLILLTNILVLAPVVGVHFLHIQGLHGMAVGVLIMLYSGMLFFIGKKLNVQFWMQVVERARLRAIIDALPGTLAWFDSKANIQGSNKKFRDLFSSKESQGRLDHPKYKEVTDIVEHLFSEEEESQSKGVEFGKQLQFFFAQKYNYDSEAVVMGMDLSKEQYWQDSLEKERAKFVKAAWSIAAGELFSLLNEAPNHVVRSIMGIIAHKDVEIILASIFEDVQKLYQHKFERENIEFVVDLETALKTKKVAGSVFVSLCCLLDNARDAVRSRVEGRIVITGRLIDGQVEISISDNGVGVDEFLTDVIFEPMFSTKDEDGNGIGLSLARDIAEGLGGQLDLEASAEGAKFVMTLPKQEAAVA